MAPAPSDETPRRRHRVCLIEDSEVRRRAITDFFSANALKVELWLVDAATSLEKIPSGADAAVIGSTPDGRSPLDILRVLRSSAANFPVILLAQDNDGEKAVAAFKLGAQDYILQTPGYLSELAFSLNHVLRRADLERRNAGLARELESVNRSLEAQVAARTRELEALSMRLIRVREDERRSIARELHDQVGQALTGLKFQIEAAVGQAEPAVKERLAEALVVATDLLARVRELTLQLRPPVLDDLGLKPAIEWHLKLFQRQTGITVESEFSLPPARLPAELEMTIFRIVQEALTNVARHSGSPTAEVTVTSDDLQIIVEITDHGHGFDLERTRAKRDSLGLSGLAERVQLAGGNLEIFSLPGRGTRVHASFPATLAAQVP